MGKIGLILKREYLTRVKKKSFIIMTILGPLLMAALFIVPVYMAQVEGETKIIGVVDETGVFYDKLPDTESIRFTRLKGTIEEAKEKISGNGIYAVLYIPKSEYSIPESAVIYSDRQPSMIVKEHIKNALTKEIEALKLAASGIEPEVLQSIETSVNLRSIKIDSSGEEEKSSTELSMALGFAGGLLIYIFIFLYGSQVMRGVIEEKTSRIVEVIVSSVRPFQLMMGKITGIALVGLTQFMIWVVFTMILVTGFMTFFSQEIDTYKSAQYRIQTERVITDTPAEEVLQDEGRGNEAVIELFEAISSINFGLVIFTFLFYFLGGYLLYAALFAAIGSAVDNETDTQQFMLPLTVPLIISIAISQFIITNPEGPVAFWLSIIPLTSPVVMMIRIPFEVHIYELILSMALLILGFIGATWVAGKVYRTGILMYGKKVNYKELWKWIRYRS